MCQLQPLPELASIRFAVSSLAQLAHKHGSYEAENADNAARGINGRITWVLEKLEEQKEKPPITARESTLSNIASFNQFIMNIANAAGVPIVDCGTHTQGRLITFVKELSERKTTQLVVPPLVPEEYTSIAQSLTQIDRILNNPSCTNHDWIAARTARNDIQKIVGKPAVPAS